jgi:hypothetical protein
MDILIDNVYDVYKSSDKDKNIKICTIMNNEYKTITLFIKMLKKEKLNDYKLTYDINKNDHGQLYDKIKSENNVLVKASLMISLFHIILYDLVEEKKVLTLFGKDEMIISASQNKFYHIIVANNEPDILLFNAFILVFSMESLFNRHFYLCMDFEYTRQKMKLAQLNYEHREDNRNFIFIIDPLNLPQNIFHVFVYYNFYNSRIRKILHGSDSLDIPHIFQDILNNNRKGIIKFTKSLIDTRFLCEYYKAIILTMKDTDKCSIYDAIIFFELISPEKKKELDDIIEGMGPHQDNVWNINQLSQSHIRYALYDVLFLKFFYYKIVHDAYKNTKDESIKSSVYKTYTRLIPEMSQFIYFERNNITDLLTQCKTEIDPINNYMIKNTSKGVVKLVDVFNAIFKNIIILKPYYIHIDNLLLINYFKTPFTIILKKMVYTLLSQKYTLYINKHDIWNVRMFNDILFSFMNKYKFDHINDLLMSFQDIINGKIKDYLT